MPPAYTGISSKKGGWGGRRDREKEGRGLCGWALVVGLGGECRISRLPSCWQLGESLLHSQGTGRNVEATGLSLCHSECNLSFSMGLEPTGVQGCKYVPT